MNDLRKAAEMALEALETLWDILDDIDTASDMAKENDAWYRKRVEALQKKRWDTMITTDGYKLKGGPVKALRQALAQPEQEPLVWMNKYGHVSSEQTEEYNAPLYTAPQNREWFGLTEDELKTLCDEWQIIYGGYVRPFAETIEAKLKEKNT